MLIQVDHRLQAIVVALAVVCVFSIFGSLLDWFQHSVDGVELRDNGQRWKWMCIVTLIIFTALILTV